MTETTHGTKASRDIEIEALKARMTRGRARNKISRIEVVDHVGLKITIHAG